MERSNTQPHDVRNIDCCSQLPSTAPKENSIRLFGKEFGGSDPTITITNNSSAPATDTATATSTATVIHHEVTKDNKERQRIFECHYCNRNFSTSQALGGHQNAHRRERLHAKRSHIQPITIHNNSSKAHLHFYQNHPNRLVIANTSPPYHHQSSIRNIINYNKYHKFYEDKTSHTSHQTPIYGMPFVASRFPTAVQRVAAFNRGLLNYSGSSSRSLYVHESKPSFNDQVSLDLHL